MLTKQHYEAIAEIVKESWDYDSCGQTMSRVCYNRISKRLADYFTRDNLRFNRQKFLDACGVS